MEMRAQKVIFKILTALSFFCFGYVLFAHLTSISELRESVQVPINEDFADLTTLKERFEIQSSKHLTYRLDSHLNITSVAAEVGDGKFEMLGPKFKLQEGTISLRLKVNSRSSYDLNFGLISERQSQRRGLFATLRNREFPGLLITGDKSVAARGHSGPLEDCTIRNSWQNVSKFEAVGSWITLTLRISPLMKRISLFRDQQMIGSCRMGWLSGEKVRLALNVLSEGDSKPLNLELAHLSYLPLQRTVPATDLVENFNGDTLDPELWSVISMFKGDNPQSFELLSGGGIMLSGVNERTTAYMALDSRLVPLQSFDAEINFEPIKLRGCSLTLGWSNPWWESPFLRSFQLDATTNRQNIVFRSSAHVDGQLLKGYLGNWRPGVYTARMTYNQNGRNATIEVNGVKHHMQIDLAPGEPVRFSIGGWCKPDTEFKLKVNSFRVNYK